METFADHTATTTIHKGQTIRNNWGGGRGKIYGVEIFLSPIHLQEYFFSIARIIFQKLSTGLNPQC